PQTQTELLAWLKKSGLPVVPKFWEADDEAAVRKAIAALEKIRHDFAFETDGAVIKLDEFKRREQTGSTSKAPRWAMAYKYEAERARTKLNTITVQVGRMGTLTPVAELEPVQIAGSRVARATLHNEEEIARKDIRVGDWVFVEKAGEVIPAVVGVDLKARTGKEKKFKMPEKCPPCGSKVFRDPELTAVRCLNPDCPSQIRRRLEHFGARGAIDIEGLGEAMVDQLVSAGLVEKLPDIYALKAGEVSALERMGEKSTANLLGAI
ncbi:MAG: NAD-dependent DNA ligase LigA, partial [Chthoniobacterales bacterium]